MGLFQKLFNRSGDEKRLQVSQGNWQPSDYLPPTIGIFNSGGRVDAGVPVDEYISLTASAVYACVAVIANSIGTLPLHVQKKDQAEKQIDHPVYNLLHDSPNEFMTSVVFRETMLLNLLLWGHCEAFIEKDEMGVPTALYPLRAAVTRPIRMFGQLQYLTQVGTTMTYLQPDQVFSVVNLTLDGITPISPIQQAKQSVGLSLALERFAAKFFANGSNMGGILSLPPMKEEAIENFVESWKKKYGGPDNALKVGMLPEGYKFTPTSTNPDNAQALEARVNQVREIARIFRVPLHKIADLEKSSYSNIEAQSREFAQDCLQPWVIKFEQEANRKLFLEREKPLLEVKFDLEGLLRADIAARYTSYNTGRQAGFLTVNEIRAKEGLPKVDGGDVLLQPLNMVPVGNSTPGKLIAPTPPTQSDDDARAVRTLLEDATRRLLVKESKAVARAAKKHAAKPQELRTWADTWYAQHQPLVARVLAPALKAAKLATTPDDYAREHCADSLRAITAAIEAGAGLDDVTDEWEAIRPAEVAENLLKKAG